MAALPKTVRSVSPVMAAVSAALIQVPGGLFLFLSIKISFLLELYQFLQRNARGFTIAERTLALYSVFGGPRFSQGWWAGIYGKPHRFTRRQNRYEQKKKEQQRVLVYCKSLFGLSKIYNGYSIVEQIDTKEEEIRKIGALGLPAPYEAFCDQYVGYNRERFDQLVNGIGLGERMMFSI